MSEISKKAVLLINLGTPDACDTRSVRRYLNEFLSDARVIDLPYILRWLLVKGLILPFRAKKSAAAYQSVWLNEGSPLLVNSLKLRDALAMVLGPSYQVVLGMRYGHPSLAEALHQIKDCRSLTVLPLFPQYSSAASGSAIQKTLEILASQWNIPSICVRNDFYNDVGYIGAYADLINTHLNNQPIDLLLFSYHGIPERHLLKSKNDENSYCYRTQCYITSELIAKQLGLSKDQYDVSFQSRLGRTPWIKPYTDELLPELINKGVKHIAVVSPSFVSDCLETLEEINIRLREQWQEIGGEKFLFIPCLNDSPVFVQALAQLVTK